MIVPLGSLEQHGPHLPLDTDTRIAVAVSHAAAVGRSGVAVAPPVAFGASGEHAAFPGTLSIGTAALVELLVELGRDATRHWGALLFVNGQRRQPGRWRRRHWIGSPARDGAARRSRSRRTAATRTPG